MPKYICIEGIIGSGKTTVLEKIKDILPDSQNISVLKERFEDNKLLELFYQKPNQYNVLTEYSFLIDRFNQIYKHFFIYKKHFTLSDFTFRKCLWFAQNNLPSFEYKQYEKYFLQLEKDLNIFPDKIIFLDVKPEQAYQNIRNRNRNFEKNISLNYLENIYCIYQKNIHSMPTPVFSIEVRDYETLIDKVIEEIVK